MQATEERQFFRPHKTFHHRRIRLRWIMAVCCGFLLVYCAAAAEIIVTAGGNIQSALDAAQAGDVVTVRGGVFSEKIIFPRSGDAASGWITLRAYPGETPILDGQGVAGADMLYAEDRSYIRIAGFEIRQNTGITNGSGIRLIGACQNVEIIGNVIHEMRGLHAMGITVYGTRSTPATNIVIRGNQVYDCDPATSEAIVLNGNVMGFEISSNTVHDVNNIGIDMIGGEADISSAGVCRNGVCRGNHVYRARSSYEDGYAAGIYVDGGKDIIVECNQVHDCDVGIEIGAENAGVVVTGVVVRSNLIFNNDKAGLGFGGYDASRGRIQNCRFYNNTCYKNDTLQTGNAELWIQWASDNVIENNIFYCGSQNKLLNSQEGNEANYLDYNLWFSEAGAGAVAFAWNGTDYAGYESYRSGTAQDAYSVFANPAFIAVAATNFRVAATSMVINAGDPAWVAAADETDYEGNPRVLDGRIDIGAYEYNSAPNPAPTVLANGANGTVILASGATLRVDVALTAGSQAGQQADWWVVAQAPSGWYYYDYINGIGWRQGIGLTFQGPLGDLPDYEILNLPGLPQGTYVIYFGVDTVPDGQISGANLYYASVTIQAQ